MKFIKIRSLRLQIILVFSTVFFLLLLLLPIANKLFIHEFFISDSVERIKDTLSNMDQIDDYNSFISKMTLNTGARVVIYDTDMEIIKGIKKNGFKYNINEELLSTLHKESILNSEGYYMVTDHIDVKERHLLYSIINKEGDFIIVNKALGAIGQATDMSVEFSKLVAIFVYIIALVIIIFLSKWLSKPIKKLGDISHKMSNLDFNEKLIVNRHDEIGYLMNSVNTLGDKLSENINSLNQSNEQLEIELNKEKSLEKMRRQFVSDVSHELKNPLSVIIAYANGLLEDIVSTEKDKREYYNIISDEAGKMNLLVKDLLDLSAYESGVFKLKSESFNIVNLIEDNLERFEYFSGKKDLEIIKSFNNEIQVYGDRLRLNQIVVNLLQNSMKYSQVGGRIEISIKKQQSTTELLIANTGDLIPESSLSKIWNSFYQVDTEKTGNGLGLAIVKSIAELHEASVSAYVIDDLNCFKLVLPN